MRTSSLLRSEKRSFPVSTLWRDHKRFRNCEQKAQKELHPRAVADLSYWKSLTDFRTIHLEHEEPNNEVSSGVPPFELDFCPASEGRTQDYQR